MFKETVALLIFDYLSTVDSKSSFILKPFRSSFKSKIVLNFFNLFSLEKNIKIALYSTFTI